MRLLLIRHGATEGNLARRYVGTTDEGLCADGRAALLGREWEQVQHVAVSPMRRCLETVECIYPGCEPVVVPDFRECDFGEFEYKSAAELSGSAAYQAWIDSGGELPFPGGESREAFEARCTAAFRALMDAHIGLRSMAIVAHGGTLMAIMARYAEPRRSYFDWHVPSGGGYTCDWDGERLHAVARLDR